MVSTGTKLHQQTKKSIRQRAGPLQTSIKKFNGYCDQLAQLAKPEWNIPLPDHLSLHVEEMKDDPALYEDVWVSRTDDSQGPQRWMTDEKVRRGIRAMLYIDRCKEERLRLYRESDNMVEWYRLRLTAMELVLRTHKGTSNRPHSSSTYLRL